MVPTDRWALFRRDGVWVLPATVVSLAIYLTTLQWSINGSQSAYATDVGEIQNALPRWGTIHFTGYPQYTFLGSLFVTALRVVGVRPAAGASLFSALLGALAIGLLVALSLALGVDRPIAAASALVVALATSNWIDASLAEIHTMTMALTMGILLVALRFGRTGERRDLYLLTIAFSQGLAHQRALAFLAPGLLLLIYPRYRPILENLGPIIALSMLAPLTYLYLPIRAWQGADWTFGQPGTWHGFWTMIADTKAERIIMLPRTMAGLIARIKTTAQLLGDDIPVGLISIGLLGILPWRIQRRRIERIGLLLVVGAYAGLCLAIWEGRISDALLAAKLPILYLTGLGLGLGLGALVRGRRAPRIAGTAALVAVSILLFSSHRPQVLAITRDPAAELVIHTVDQIDASPEAPVTFMALWGHDYWALAYAKAYRGQLSELSLVDHNARFVDIVERGDRLLTLERTLYQRPVEWWEDRLGPLHLASVVPGVIELSRSASVSKAPLGVSLDLGNGIEVASARLDADGETELVLTVYWRAQAKPEHDYGVGVHLLARAEPSGPDDILAQADSVHPVYGWYPTSRWRAGELVRDHYVVLIPAGTRPAGVRVGMYRRDAQGRFVNSEWLYLPVPNGATSDVS